MAQQLPPFPPNTYFLPVEETWEDSVWLHGTRSGKLEGIAKHGILPRRDLKSKGNWAEHPSHKDMVYLTTAYGLHYAKATEAVGLPAILELDLSQLDRARFFGDEDTYALSQVEGMEFLQALPIEKKVEFWRKNIAMTEALTSLRVMGNATYKGVIPASAVKRVRLLTEGEALTMTLRISDPVVSPQNFKLLGGAAQRFHKWLLGQPTELDEWFERSCTPSLPLMTLDEAVARHQAHAKESRAPAAGKKKPATS